MTLTIDLTKPLDRSLRIYSSGEYSDPSFKCEEWCSVPLQGFRVSRIELGTQTGTHIDAPAHFCEGGLTLEKLPPDKLVGEYFLIDLSDRIELPDLEKQLDRYCRQEILFLRTSGSGISELSKDALNALIEVPASLWVLSGEVMIAGSADYEFHRLIAQAGKFLVEDLDQIAARQVPISGEIFALPLRLVGTSGAPCRLLVRGLNGPG